MKLPSPTEAALLNSLGTLELSGRELAKAYSEQTGRAMPFGTLYTAMRRLKESGWVETRDDNDEDGRLRFFSVTGSGIAAMNAVNTFRPNSLTLGGLAVGGITV
ncbi:MAG TPA: PadR family transcriptional regulator [Candidatus Limnocylindria bacterium]|jgi:DNA-binding PadR family transcriptional regulator|nr:PadR family transcriptional regulator [Candidatus Limnocylindria bacterium]